MPLLQVWRSFIRPVNPSCGDDACRRRTVMTFFQMMRRDLQRAMVDSMRYAVPHHLSNAYSRLHGTVLRASHLEECTIPTTKRT